MLWSPTKLRKKFLRNENHKRNEITGQVLHDFNLLDPEYKKKREQRFLLSHQKHAQSSNRRKLLKVQHGYSVSGQEDGIFYAANFLEDDEPSVNELEFSLKHNPEDLLNKSDILALSIKEINLIKLLICSGLYPNIAIADEANYYRKLNEQAFHTSSKRYDILILIN